MPIQLQISPRLITNIASLYNDSNRMYMEFIDNSIDSAEEYFDAKTNSYKKEILEADHHISHEVMYCF